MCGLTGFAFAGGDAAQLEATARSMADRIRHRGPDDDGVWVDQSAGFALGHRRLAILDTSPAGHQPMASPNGRWVLAYNGEIYNHLALRSELAANSATLEWRGHSDTETLLACIQAWGLERTLRVCVGMFALALWDRDEHCLSLARDRLGEKPLYYGWQGDTFLFGSELKALRAHPAFSAPIDRDALALLLRHNYIPAPYSIYQGISKLPPGTFLQIRRGQRNVQPTAYWSLQSVSEQGMRTPFPGSEADALGELERLLGAAVRGQTLSDVPLGALLSGGIDSTLVTALMQAGSSRAVRTFTVGFDEHGYDEAIHARKIAAHLGTEHTELRLQGSDALEIVPQLPSMYDEPFADSSQLPTHLVMRMARQHVTVALSGDGGDEMFGGYNRYRLAPQVWNRIRLMPEPLRRTLGAAMTAVPAAALNRLFAAVAPSAGVALPGDKLHKLGSRLRNVRSVDDLYVALVSEWSDVDGLVIGGRVPSNLLDTRSQWPRLHDPVARMMALDGMTYLPDDILAKVDRAAMAVSLETRAPFLDRDVVEFAWSLPMAMKIHEGQGKWLLRRLLDRHVPATLIDRPKMGFGIPLDAWLRGPLRDWAEDLLDVDRLRREGFLNPLPIRRAWERHMSGEASHGYRLWSVLMFQAWLADGGNTHNAGASQ